MFDAIAVPLAAFAEEFLHVAAVLLCWTPGAWVASWHGRHKLTRWRRRRVIGVAGAGNRCADTLADSAQDF